LGDHRPKIVASLHFGLDPRHKTITAARKRPDLAPRRAPVVDDLADRRNTAVDGGIGHQATVPYCRDEVITRHDPRPLLHEIAQESEDLGLKLEPICAEAQFAAVRVKRVEVEFVEHRVIRSRQTVHHRLRRIEIKTEATDGNKSQRFSRKIMPIAIKAHWDCG